MLPLCLLWHLSPVISLFVGCPGMGQGKQSQLWLQGDGRYEPLSPFSCLRALCPSCSHHLVSCLCFLLSSLVPSDCSLQKAWETCFKAFNQSIRSVCHGPRRNTGTATCTASPGEPRNAPYLKPGTTSLTLHRARSRFLFKPYLQQLGSTLIIHLTGQTLAKETGWVVLWRWDF